jgi:hypothetical protein
MTGIQAKGPSQYPYGFSNGINVRGVNILNSYAGNVVWVDSNFGNNGNPGTVNLPVATIAGAITLLSNLGGHGNGNRGDVIMIKPKHAETLAVATTYALAGTQIIGISSGEGDMPTLTLSAVASTVKLNAADMLMSGIKIKTNAATTIAVTLAATGCIIDNCRIVDGSASFVTGISVIGGGSNLADRCVISDNFIFSAGATQGIFINEVDDLVQIVGNVIQGNYSAGTVKNTAAVLTNLSIIGNLMSNTATNAPLLTITAACTGLVMNNAMNGAATATKAIGSLLSSNNFIGTTAF